MRVAALVIALLLGLAAGASAQDTLDPLATNQIYQCAVLGGQTPGCTFTAPSCTTFEQRFAGCPAVTFAELYALPGTPVPTPPPPSVEPPPTAVSGIAGPTGLADTGPGVSFTHDGANVQWFTLRVDGAYQSHVNSDIRFIAYAVLVPGAHTVTVDACGDAGCTASAPLQVTR